jgi:uncharacterized heparinase superfamily protein
MYHALAVEDMLDLVNITNAYGQALPRNYRKLAASWPAILAKMRQCLAMLCHPDGDISFFNDSAIGIAPRALTLDDYANRLGLKPVEDHKPGLEHLSDSGYIRIENDEAVALLDVAPAGPDYLPGHAHADTLSFELSLFNRRVLVNSGTSVYGNSSERHRQRGTAAHNTVVVNGQNSSEVWAGFRVARRARPFALEFHTSNGQNVSVSCAHDGYRRLPGRVVHRRCWQFLPGQITIADTVQGTFRKAEALLHFHPECKVRGSDKTFRVDLPAGRHLDIDIAGGQAVVHPGTWHPEFGLSINNQCLIVSFAKSQVETTLSWR